MSIHPMVQDFLNHPMPEMVFDEPPTVDPVKWKEGMERVNAIMSNMTPEQHEKARVAAHHYLFGKDLQPLH